MGSKTRATENKRAGRKKIAAEAAQIWRGPPVSARNCLCGSLCTRNRRQAAVNAAKVLTGATQGAGRGYKRISVRANPDKEWGAPSRQAATAEQ